MGGDHHHHGEPYKVPHPSIYKVENIPQLKQVQEALSRQGLKDPWLRNEAWRYDTKQFGTHASRARAFFLRGFVWGLAAAVITVGLERAFDTGHDHHGDGHVSNFEEHQNPGDEHK